MTVIERGIKQKLLAALDCTIEDLTAERLVDLLVDAFQARIKK